MCERETRWCFESTTMVDIATRCLFRASATGGASGPAKRMSTERPMNVTSRLGECGAACGLLFGEERRVPQGRRRGVHSPACRHESCVRNDAGGRVNGENPPRHWRSDGLKSIPRRAFRVTEMLFWRGKAMAKTIAPGTIDQRDNGDAKRAY